MKKAWSIGIVVLFAVGLGGISPAAGQGELERLESGIRASNGPPAMAVAPTQRVYLGARADNDISGVRVLSVSSGGPADRAGLQAHDLIVGAAGHKIHMLAELSTVLNGLKPGDRLSLQLVRGNQPLQAEVVLGAPLGTAQPGTVPPTGPAARRVETIPPPPGDTMPAPSIEGPAFGAPSPPLVPGNRP
ncbi:MAG: PDZ domain-containing protein, partial [Thermoguttaceae bacterium]